MSQLLIDWQKLGNEALNILKTVGINLLKALGIFILGFLAIKIVMKILNKIFSKTKAPKVTVKFLLSVIKFSLYMLLLIAICQVIGIPITGFVAVISAAGLALSLAMQGSLSNFANGVVIISTRPFKEGDYIAIGSVEGTVSEIKLLHTIINTVDNKTVSIPNSKVVENELINYSANPTRKVIFNFDVDYATDVEKAKQIVLDVMTNCNLVIVDPAPFCALKTLDSSSIRLTANCWCYGNDYWTVYYEIMDKVFNEFKRNDISIPFNQMEVRLRSDKVVMPYKVEPIAKRDEEIAVKPYVQEEGDALDKMFNKLKKRDKHKEKKEKKEKKKKNKQ